MSRVSALKPNPVVSDLAHLVVAAMERKGHQVDRGPGEVNIVYVEGMNPDGTANADEANKWNDLRLLIRFEGGEPRIIGEWAATTEPGRYWTENPMNPLGAARIEFGQYKAWQVGIHNESHEALVQTGGPLTVCRDLNKDGQRTGDKRQTGEFGINQHWGYDLPQVEKASAGCLVGQSKDGHRQFMALVKSDPRYQANRKYVFATAVLQESDVLTGGVVEAEAPSPDMLPPGSVDGSDAVRRLQKLLGFSEAEQDGIFGAKTEEAVRQFQRRHGLTVTGDADDKTRDLLERQLPDEIHPWPIEPRAKVSAPVRPSGRYTGITATVFGGSSEFKRSDYDGHVITDDELGVALPFRFGGTPPTVRVFNPANGASVVCDIVDVGPWNSNDPYWQTGARPQAESGVAQDGSRTNLAGIDLTPAAARQLGIDGKGEVQWEFAAPSAAQPSMEYSMLSRLMQRLDQLEGRCRARRLVHCSVQSLVKRRRKCLVKILGRMTSPRCWSGWCRWSSGSRPKECQEVRSGACPASRRLPRRNRRSWARRSTSSRPSSPPAPTASRCRWARSTARSVRPSAICSTARRPRSACSAPWPRRC